MPDLPRLTVRAKFFYDGEEKFTMQAVTYGPFRPAEADGPHLPSPERVREDLRLMGELGINTVRIYHAPPTWFLDLLQEHRVRCMVTIPWHKRVLFLDNNSVMNETRRTVRDAVRQNAGHPAILGYYIDNEIPPDLVRWYGPKRMERWLDGLMRLVKRNDPEALVAYANFPPTEYLLPNEADFYAYNVYLHNQEEFASYLARLQNLAGDKPLVLSEFGMDTIRHPEAEQAELLRAHVETVFRAGLAGTTIFSWTDEWFTDGVDVTDWAFGLVTAERRPKESYQALREVLADPGRPLYERFPLLKTPKVSVVVCTYNGGPTLRDCLVSLSKVQYPDYEVIVVDDGSTDATQEIMQDFPKVRNMQQANRGLSVARNVGIKAATGDIVAFTDSDCMADADWLYFLVSALESGDYAAVGGPNLSPPATNWVQATVAAAPGSPSHVLLTDTVAEHVPGCNMAYYKWALEEIDGFDPEYRKAGDDVDVCWRLMQRDYQIGFSAAAIVWHYRRFTVKAYLSQQRGYGEAEALLRYKHMNYFGTSGTAIWHGHVYSQVRLTPLVSQPIVYHGIFGTGLFQSVYQRPASGIPAIFGSLEWLGLSLFVFLLSLPLESLRMLPLVMFGLTLIVGLVYTAQVQIERRFDSLCARLLLLYLALNQPWRRAWARYFTWLRGKSTPRPIRENTTVEPTSCRPGLLKAGMLSYWSDAGVERTCLLDGIQERLRATGWRFTVDTGWTDWDIHVFASRWWSLRLRTMTEIYPNGRRLTRVGNYLHTSNFSVLTGGMVFTFTLILALVFQQFLPGFIAFASLVLLSWFCHGLALRRQLADLVQGAACKTGLTPVGARKNKDEKTTEAEPVS